MATKLEFLAEHSIFSELTDAELWTLSQIALECEFGEDSVIAYQRDVADGIVIVKSGRLFAQEVDQYGRVRDANTREFTENEYFGAEWLFETGTQPATVTGTHDGRIITINGEDFRHFLISYPDAIHRLEPVFDEEGELESGLPEDAWERADKLPLKEKRDHIGPIVAVAADIMQNFVGQRFGVLMLPTTHLIVWAFG